MSEKPSKWYDEIYTDEIMGNHKAFTLMVHWANSVSPHTVGSVLDLGCGLAILPETKHMEYTGVDFSKVAIGVAKKKITSKKAKLVLADIADYVKTVDDNAFDTVVLSEVLEHLEQPENVVREAKRIAKCKVIITVPMNSPNPAHVKHIWSVEDLRRLIGPLAVVEDIRGFWLVVWEKGGRQTESLKKH